MEKQSAVQIGGVGSCLAFISVLALLQCQGTLHLCDSAVAGTMQTRTWGQESGVPDTATVMCVTEFL